MHKDPNERAKQELKLRAARRASSDGAEAAAIQEKLKQSKARMEQMAEEKAATERAKLAQAQERQATLDRQKKENAELEARKIEKKVRLQALVFNRMIKAGLAKGLEAFKEHWLSTNTLLAQAALARLRWKQQQERQRLKEEHLAREAERRMLEFEAQRTQRTTCCLIA